MVVWFSCSAFLYFSFKFCVICISCTYDIQHINSRFCRSSICVALSSGGRLASANYLLQPTRPTRDTKGKKSETKNFFKDTNGKLHSGNGYCMVLSCIDTIEMILSDWRNIGTEPSENLKNFYYKTPNLRASAEVE